MVGKRLGWQYYSRCEVRAEVIEMLLNLGAYLVPAYIMQGCYYSGITTRLGAPPSLAATGSVGRQGWRRSQAV